MTTEVVTLWPDPDELDAVLLAVVTAANGDPMPGSEVALQVRRHLKGVSTWQLNRSINRLRAAGRIEAEKYGPTLVVSLPIQPIRR